jgi:hypothetical protein
VSDGKRLGMGDVFFLRERDGELGVWPPGRVFFYFIYFMDILLYP